MLEIWVTSGSCLSMTAIGRILKPWITRHELRIMMTVFCDLGCVYMKLEWNSAIFSYSSVRFITVPYRKSHSDNQMSNIFCISVLWRMSKTEYGRSPGFEHCSFITDHQRSFICLSVCHLNNNLEICTYLLPRITKKKNKFHICTMVHLRQNYSKTYASY